MKEPMEQKSKGKESFWQFYLVIIMIGAGILVLVLKGVNVL
jgi:hypothetical protein